MISSKKGMIWYYIILPMFALAIIAFVIFQLGNKPETYPGQIHLNILKVHDYSKGIEIYLESAAQRAAAEALPELAKNGGFDSNSECTDYLGYQVWTESCTPKLKSSYEEYFNGKMLKIVKHPDDKKFIQFDNTFSIYPELEGGYYKLALKNKELAAGSDKPIRIKMYPKAYAKFNEPESDIQARLGIYSFRPNIKITTPFDYSSFSEIESGIEEIRKSENSIQASEKIKQLNSDNLKWTVNACTPTTAPEQFYDIVEHIQKCMRAQDNEGLISCRCDLVTPESLKLLDGYSIELETVEINGNRRIKAELVYSGEVIRREMIDGDAQLALPTEDRFELEILAEQQKVTVLNQLSQKTSFFRYKNSENNLIAFIDDDHRNGLYDQFSECKPEITKFRMCITAGATNFKIAVELPDSSENPIS